MKVVRVVMIILDGVGFILLVAAVLCYQHERAFVAGSETAEATVLELVPVHSDGSTTYAPVLRFQTPAGRPVEFRSNVSSTPPSYRKGQTVQVRYDPADPDAAVIDSFFSLWLGTIILAPMAGLSLCTAAVLAVVWLRSRRARPPDDVFPSIMPPAERDAD